MLDLRFNGLIPGLLFCALISLAASYFGAFQFLQVHGLGALTLAIVMGMVLGNICHKNSVWTVDPGINFSKHNLLRIGIVLYGFRLTLQDIVGVGLTGLFSDVLVLCSTFFLALFIGIKVLKLQRDCVILIGAGSSICGAAAIMAADGVVEADAEQVSVAVSTVVVFGSAAIFLYPILYRLNLSWHLISGGANAFGIYAGSTIHEVAQVVAAGRSISPEVANVAVITKMVRVMMLAPFLLLLPLLLSSKSAASNPELRKQLSIPWFAFFFTGTALFNSLHIFPARLVEMLVQVDTLMLAMAMAALGFTTKLSSVRQAGVRPLLLALILFIWLIIGGAIISKLVFWL